MRTELPTHSGVRITECDSWEDFVAKIRVEKVGPRIYRGQRSPGWKLSSLWERRMRKPDLDLDRYLQDFKDNAIGIPGFRSDNLQDLDWWLLGRHYGLMTPYLDWTKSPYIAAFFAFSDLMAFINPGFTSGSFPPIVTTVLGSNLPYPYSPNLRLDWAGFEKQTIAVWELVLEPAIQEQFVFEIVMSRQDYAVRQKSQQGVFTRLTHAEFFGLESYLISKGQSIQLEKYTIPGNEILMALRDLQLMNITYVTMFNDLFGAAAQANIRQYYYYPIE